jgi:hypothetical protein
MKRLSFLLCCLTFSAVAAETSIDGEWITAVDEQGEKRMLEAFPNRVLTDDEKKMVAALGKALAQFGSHVFKKDGSFEVHTTASQKQLDEARELMNKLKLKADYLDKYTADTPIVRYKGDWKRDGNKLILNLRAPDGGQIKIGRQSGTMITQQATITDDEITMENGAKLRKKK